MAQQIFAQFYLTNLVHSLDRTTPRFHNNPPRGGGRALLASVMIHSDAKRRLDISSTLTGLGDLPG
jgi:hypothetical protein